MSNENTSTPVEGCPRRQYLAGIAGVASLALAGCSGGTSGSGETTTTQDPCLKDHSQKFCKAEDFVLAVKNRVQNGPTKEGVNPPKTLGAGVYKNQSGEVIEDRVVIEIVPDGTSTSALSEDVGYVAGAYAYYIDDYDYVARRMDISIIGPTDERQYLGKFHVVSEWAQTYNEGKMSSEEYVSSVLATGNVAGQ